MKTKITSVAAFALFVVGAVVAQAGEVKISSNKAIITALFDAFNSHDSERLASFYSADAKVYSPESCEPTVGPDAIAAGYAEMFAQIPDIHDQLELVVDEGNRVAVTFTATGTVEGYQFALPIAAFIKIENGKITEDRVYFDTDIELQCD